MTAVPRVAGTVAGPGSILIGAVGAAMFASLAVLVLLLAFYRAAFAQHHNHPPQDAALHSFGIGWRCLPMLARWMGQRPP